VVVSVFSRSFLCEHKNANPQEMKKKMEREGKSAPHRKRGGKKRQNQGGGKQMPPNKMTS
jgi:hypothetical protein